MAQPMRDHNTATAFKAQPKHNHSTHVILQRPVWRAAGGHHAAVAAALATAATAPGHRRRLLLLLPLLLQLPPQRCIAQPLLRLLQLQSLTQLQQSTGEASSSRHDAGATAARASWRLQPGCSAALARAWQELPPGATPGLTRCCCSFSPLTAPLLPAPVGPPMPALRSFMSP